MTNTTTHMEYVSGPPPVAECHRLGDHISPCSSTVSSSAVLVSLMFWAILGSANGSDGKNGNCGNGESATYRSPERRVGSNPALTARFVSKFHLPDCASRGNNHRSSGAELSSNNMRIYLAVAILARYSHKATCL